jgi:cytoskeletal protein RodZ
VPPLLCFATAIRVAQCRSPGHARRLPTTLVEPGVIMRKLAIAVAIAFAALSASAVLACDQTTQTAEQPQQKPAVAEKTQKQNKQKKAKKTEKTERSENTAVARADK